MATLMKRGPLPEGSGLSKQVIGNAVVVHPTGPVTPEARELAVRLPRDEENDLVMLDLPLGSPISLWQSVASVIDRHRRGIRLVIDGHPRETVALAAGWLSERLGRVVIAADGQMFTGAGGCLFIDSGPNTGWMRFHPGRPPQWESKRFPRPFWDSHLTAEVTATSSLSVCEPLPGGLWIRPVGSEASLQNFRALLFESVPLLKDTLTIVVGSPGTRAVSLDDVRRVRAGLPAEVRQNSRLASLGPVSIPPGSTLGQAMADLTGEDLICYNGIPVGGDTRPPEVRAVQPDGRGGGWPFALELGYRPQTLDGSAAVPAVFSHRRPFRGLTEIAPGVYRHGHDALVEVVQSGLLVRPVAEGERTTSVRQVAMDSSRHFLVVDGEDAGAVLRMQGLAEDLLGQLDEPTRRMSQIVSAENLLASDPSGLMEVAVAEDAVLEDAYDVNVVAQDLYALDAALDEQMFAADAGYSLDEALEDDDFAGAAVFEAPGVEAPVFEAPVSGTPVFEAPVFEAPGLEVTSFEVPAAQPVSTEPAMVVAAEPTPTPAPRAAHRAAPARFRLESSGVPGAVEAPGPALAGPVPAAPAPSGPAPIAPAPIGPVPTAPAVASGSAPAPERSIAPNPMTANPMTANPAAGPVTNPGVGPAAPTGPAMPPLPPARSVPGQSVPGQPVPGQPIPGQQAPGQPIPAQPGALQTPTAPPGFNRAGSAPPAPGAPALPAEVPAQPVPAQPVAAQPIDVPPSADVPGQPTANVDATAAAGLAGTGAMDVLAGPAGAEPTAPVAVKARLQPTPPPAARGLLPDRPIEEERVWLRKALAADFSNMSTSVARVLSEHPGFEGVRDGSSAALTDAVAVRLYLSPRGATLDAALRTGKVGPHIPLARCLVAGLSRLPSHRGPTSFAAAPTPGQWDLYRRNPKVTEWGFVNTVTGPCTDQPGDTDVLIWSMTGRRTRLLEADNGGVPNRVLFVPGTRFKVLELNEPGPNARGLIMMRELTARDLDDQGQVDVVQRSFDELALTSMRRDHESWSGASRSSADGAAPGTHFGALPGLM